jgi:hypothetical protein
MDARYLAMVVYHDGRYMPLSEYLTHDPVTEEDVRAYDAEYFKGLAEQQEEEWTEPMAGSVSHSYKPSDNPRLCAVCGGGILHEIHDIGPV